MPARPSSEIAGPSIPSREIDPGGPGRSCGEDSAWVSDQVQAIASAWARGEDIAVEELLERTARTQDRGRHPTGLRGGLPAPRGGSGSVHGRGRVPISPVERGTRDPPGLRSPAPPLSRTAILPEVGERLGPFRLLCELGRGASGKTYLAAEPALADRLVVLKIIPDDQEEHLSLARLQHTHIIPLFSEQTFEDRGLRALCMPYLGGTSLARILESLAEIPTDQLQGCHLLEVLGRVQTGRPAPPASDDGPYRRYLDQASYVHAICWISACLADALARGPRARADPHGRQAVECPDRERRSAHAPRLSPGSKADQGRRADCRPVGGTPGWMAPEQEDAMKAVSLGQAVPKSVDHRADLYALGLLLRDALRIPRSFVDGTPGTWRDSRRSPGEHGSDRHRREVPGQAAFGRVTAMRPPWRMTCAGISMTCRSAASPTVAWSSGGANGGAGSPAHFAGAPPGVSRCLPCSWRPVWGWPSIASACTRSRPTWKTGGSSGSSINSPRPYVS